MIRKAAGMVTTFILKALRIAGVVLLSASMGLASGGMKQAELNQALEDIREAAQSIGARAAATAVLLAHLQTQCDALKAEIQEERRRFGVATWRQAAQVRRIHSDLRLLGQAAGYAVQLEDRLAYFRAAAIRLSAYRDQVRDDLLMLKALDDVDSSTLLRQIRDALDEFQRQCAAPLLYAQLASSRHDPETLWNELLKGP